jgi:hypothetical protein
MKQVLTALPISPTGEEKDTLSGVHSRTISSNKIANRIEKTEHVNSPRECMF